MEERDDFLKLLPQRKPLGPDRCMSGSVQMFMER